MAIVHADDWDILDDWFDDLDAALDWTSAAYAKIHPRRASRLSPREVSDLAPSEPLWGNDFEELEVLEHGVRYLVRPDGGLSVGLFLDMRDVRAWLREHTRGRMVLNLFAYTCSLGVVSSLGGAARVVNVDVSRTYLDWGKANYGLNELAVDDRDFIYGDAFDWLGRFGRRGTFFDMVIVDPPSYSSTPFAVTRDYERLVAAAARVVVRAGMLVAATNHAGVSDHQLDIWLQAGLALADRHGRLVQRWHEPQPDFPVPSGRQPYLKVRALELD